MQEINESFYLVTQSVNFWWYMSTILSLGMVIGAKFDHKLRGFTRSLALLVPYTSIIFLTNFSRLYETSQKTHLGATSFNSMWTIIIITAFYIVGLFIGHMIDQKAKHKAQTEHTTAEKKTTVAVINANVKEIRLDVKELLDK